MLDYSTLHPTQKDNNLKYITILKFIYIFTKLYNFIYYIVDMSQIEHTSDSDNQLLRLQALSSVPRYWTIPIMHYRSNLFQHY